MPITQIAGGGGGSGGGGGNVAGMPSMTTVISARVINVYKDYSTNPADSIPYPPGTVEVQYLNSTKIDPRPAYPMDMHTNTLPVVGEFVDVFVISNIPFYRRKGFYENANSLLSLSTVVQGPESKQFPSVLSGFINNFKSGLQQTTANSAINDAQGSGIFRKKPISLLKFYDGDTIIQSRFGSSIRLSGYNYNGAAGTDTQQHPSIIIRNRQSPLTPSENYVSTEEDINRDGSTIAITSGKYESKFLPGKVNKEGNSDFKLKVFETNGKYGTGKNQAKYGFENYPSKLDGDQIVITSNRLIFSSRTAETIFWSKGWYGVVSDEAISFDAMGGVNITSHRNDIDMEAYGKSINLRVGKSGTINLGNEDDKTTELEPAVFGTELVNVLAKIIDALQNLGIGGVLTPAGPATGPTPIIIKDLQQIRADLQRLLLSKKVYIGKPK